MDFARAYFGFFTVKVGMQRCDEATGSGQSLAGLGSRGPGFDDESIDDNPRSEFPSEHLFDPGDGDSVCFGSDAGGFEPGPLQDFPQNVFAGVLSQTCNSKQFDSQPVISSAVNDALFAKSLFSNVDITGIKLPWEVGIYRDLFSDEPMAEPLVPKMPIGEFCCFDVGVAPQQVAETVAALASRKDVQPVFEKCISSCDELQYHEKRLKLRDAAIGKLLIVLNQNLEVSSTGRHLMQLGRGDDAHVEASEIVSAVVGLKSPATLVKRANSLLAFMRWCSWVGKDACSVFQESVVWEYFQHLKSTGAPASKADSMLSAVRFAFYVLGFDCLGVAVSSRRLIGASELMLAGKRLLRQALVLTVAQVKRLHSILVDRGRHLIDRVIVVHILFALYGRCRHSDLLDIHDIGCDFDDQGGFVTLSTCSHKTGRVASLKTRLMPIVIPARGVDGSIWPSQALEVLKVAGCLPMNPINGPLVHAPAGGNGTFMKRGLRSTEVSKALRCFLELPEPVPGCDVEVISSHSLKATLLSWAARFGLSPQTRSLLGRHTSCLNETFAIYSRDLTCAPVAELQKLIDAISAGEFEPDGERSKFFRKPVPGVEVAQQTPVKDECSDTGDFILIHDSPESVNENEAQVNLPEGDGGFNLQGLQRGDQASGLNDGDKDADSNGEPISDSASSSDGSDGSSSDGPDLGAVQHRVKRFRARIPADEKWFVHCKSHLVHRFDGNQHNDVKFLVCGKRLTDSYQLCTEATAWNTLCRSCNRR